jgi:hypothetical protein
MQSVPHSPCDGIINHIKLARAPEARFVLSDLQYRL